EPVRGQLTGSRRAVGREVRQLDGGLRIAGCDRGDRADAHRVARAVAARVVEAADDQRGGPVTRRADVEQTERIGNQGRVQYVFDRHRLPVARVRILEPV